MPGQIIIITGTSGAGKSTAARLLARRSADFYLLFGIDHFLSTLYPAKFSMHGPRSREGVYCYHEDENDPASTYRWGFGPYGWQSIHALHEMVAAVSRAGLNVVLDHLMFVDPPILQDCIWRLQDLPVLLVSLKPPYEVLLERIASRTIDKPVPAAEVLGTEGLKKAIEKLQKLTPWFYAASYANECCDLIVDSGKHAPEQVCELIERRLAQGPGGAFELLRERYPQA